MPDDELVPVLTDLVLSFLRHAEKQIHKHGQLIDSVFTAEIPDDDVPLVLREQEHLTLNDGVIEDPSFAQPARAALRALRKRGVNCFAGPVDLFGCLAEQFTAWALTGGRLEDLRTLSEPMVAFLQRPLRVFGYTLTLPPHLLRVPEGWPAEVEGPIQFELGPNLRLADWKDASRTKGLSQHAIEGKVEAWGWSAAQRQAARTVCELFGASCVLGLGYEGPPLDDEAELPELRFDPPPPAGFPLGQPPYDLRRLAGRISFTYPMAPTELELSSGSVERYRRALKRLFADVEPRALVLRNACRMWLLAHRQHELGASIGDFFTVLEAVLLDRHSHSDVLARLAEALAFRVGGAAAAREQIRARAKELYRLRSDYAHTGRVETEDLEEAVDECARLSKQVLRMEIQEF